MEQKREIKLMVPEDSILKVLSLVQAVEGVTMTPDAETLLQPIDINPQTAAEKVSDSPNLIPD